MDELRQHLESLHSEGRFDSSAGFSIDLSDARRKRGQHQLGDPTLCLLKLVQAAVAGGASRIRFRVAPGIVVAGFDPKVELESLPDLLYRTAPDQTALHHLSTAVLAALATNPTSLCLEGPGLRFQSRGTEVQVERGPEAGRFDCRFELNLPPAEGFFNKSSVSDAQCQALKERCLFAPIPVSLHGFPLNAPVPGAELRSMREKIVLCPPEKAQLAAPTFGARLPVQFQLADRTLSSPDDGKGARWLSCAPPEREAPFPVWELPEETRITFSHRTRAGLAVATVTGLDRLLLPHLPWLGAHAIFNRSSARAEPTLTFVEQGVMLAPKRLPSAPMGLTVIMENPGLTKDLSGFGIVEDVRYQEVLGWVRQQAAELSS